MNEGEGAANPFRAKGRWYRGNLHAHTTGSDGALSPAELAGKYRERGYDFLAITDHEVATPVEGLGDEGFVVLRGEEIGTDRCEIVGLNLRETISGEGKRAEAVLEEIREQGGLASLAHPRGYDCPTGNHVWRDEGVLGGIFGMEIYNASMQAACGIGEALALWDAAMQRGDLVYGIAADDAHWHFGEERPHDVGRAFVLVRAKALTAGEIVEALREGQFYSSTGLLIEDIEVSEEEVTVTCPEARSISAITNGAWGKRKTLVEKPISPARFRIAPRARYLRIECEDAEGRRAWTNPVVWRE